jgi:hypothetical protein
MSGKQRTIVVQGLPPQLLQRKNLVMSRSPSGPFACNRDENEQFVDRFYARLRVSNKAVASQPKR